MVAEPAGCRSNYWLQTILLDEKMRSEQSNILAATNAAGIMTRPVWALMHTLTPYSDCPRMDLTAAESLQQRLINLPSSAHLGKEEAC